VKWKSRHGLRDDGISTSDDAKKEALQFGARGETHAYWHLRHLDYIFVRTAHYFLRERHIKECPLRFNVVAIDGVPGRRPASDSTKRRSARKPDAPPRPKIAQISCVTI